MQYVFRLAKEEDRQGIANVLINSYNIQSIQEGIEAFIREMSEKHIFVVAEVEGKISGIASYRMHGLPKHGLAELDRIAVLPELRGKGLSTQLFEMLLAEVKRSYEEQNSKLRKLYLLTHADNTIAQDFYKKLGFSYETSLKNHYYTGKEEFVMSMFF